MILYTIFEKTTTTSEPVEITTIVPDSTTLEVSTIKSKPAITDPVEISTVTCSQYIPKSTPEVASTTKESGGVEQEITTLPAKWVETKTTTVQNKETTTEPIEIHSTTIKATAGTTSTTQTEPIYPSNSNSSLIPIYTIEKSGGPSAQNLGFRHVLLSAITLKKSITPSVFFKHKTDKSLSGKAASVKSVPFGLRFDFEEICKLVEVKVLTKDDYPTKQKPLNILNLIEERFYKQKLNDLDLSINRNTYSLLNDLSYTFPELLEGKDEKARKKLFNLITTPGLIYHLLPKSDQSVHSLPNLFKKLNLNSKNNTFIGIANSNMWIFDSFYKLIDDGGVYRKRNAIKGKSKAPFYTKKQAKEIN